jgi:WD40 repeat protein
MDELRQMLGMHLADLTVNIDAVVSPNATLPEKCTRLVLWALHQPQVGLQGLLAAAIAVNPTNGKLNTLRHQWAGITFTRPGCPYPGLKPYTANSKRFYGRNVEIEQAIDRLRRHSFLALIGPSGSGKSSLLAAGILPALEHSHFFADRPWLVRQITPGALPGTALAAALDLQPWSLREEFPSIPQLSGARLLLVVDQYEEVFTLADAAQRTQFEAASLRLLAEPNVCVLIAIRADFRLNLTQSSLWAAGYANHLDIEPLYGDALREAIVQPANDAGVQITPELAERLLADAGREPGVLPLIQETLVMLWQRMSTFELGLDAYTSLIGDQSGLSGLQVALARHADDIYDHTLAGEEERTMARRIFLRLIQFGEGRSDTRRAQTAEELLPGIGEAQHFARVREILTANRLLTSDSEPGGGDSKHSVMRLNLAHETLIQSWPKLAEWVTHLRTAELARRRLEEKTLERRRLRQEDEAGGLLDIVELAEAEDWIRGPEAPIVGASDALQQLITDSRQALDAAAEEKERNAERLRRRNQWLAAALTTALVAIGIAAVFFWNLQIEAQNARLAEAAAQTSAAEAVVQAEAAATQAAIAQTNAVEAGNQRATAEAARIAAEQQQEAAEYQRSRAESALLRSQADNLAAIAQLQIQRGDIDNDLRLLLARDAVLKTLDSPEHYVTANADAALRAAVDNASWRMTLPAAAESHQGPVNAVAYSPDGKWIASGGNDMTVRLWDAATLKPNRMLLGHASAVMGVAFSPDGTKVASIGLDAAWLWDVNTGRAIRQLGKASDFTAVMFSPDGKEVAITTPNHVRLQETESGEFVAFLGADQGSINAAGFSPDGSVLATGSSDGAVRLWDVQTGSLIRMLAGHKSDVKAVVFSPSGTLVASGGEDGALKLWDVRTGTPLHTLEPEVNAISSLAFSRSGGTIVVAGLLEIAGIDVRTATIRWTAKAHNDNVTSIAFHPLGEAIVSASYDHSLRLWDARSGRRLGTTPGHTWPVDAVSYSPDGNLLASGGMDDTVRLWDARTGEELHVFSGDGSGAPTRDVEWVHAVAFSPDGQLLAAGDSLHAVHVWNVQTRAPQRTLLGHSGDVNTLAFSPDGRLIASGAEGATHDDLSLRLWDVRTGQIVHLLAGHRRAVNSLAFSPDGSTLVSGSDDGTVRLWDVETGKQLRILVNHPDAVLAVAFSPDGDLIASAGVDGSILLSGPTSGSLLRMLPSYSLPIYSLAFHPDSTLLAASGPDGMIRIWDLMRGSVSNTIASPVARVKSVVFSPDGATLASSSGGELFGWEDIAIRLWDVRTFGQRRLLMGQDDGVSTLAFSPDGTTLASGGDTSGVAENSPIQIWAVQTGEPLRLLAGHKGSTLALAYSPGGELIASGGNDDNINLWDVQTGQLVRVFKQDEGSTYSLSFSPDGRLLASVDSQGGLWLRDVQTGAVQRTIKILYHTLSPAVFSPDGTLIATAMNDYWNSTYFGVALWNVETGALVRRFMGHHTFVPSVAFSPDGALVAGGNSEGTILVWDTQTGAMLHRFEGHTNRVSALAFSPNGRFLVSGSSNPKLVSDNTIRVWDLQTDEQVRILEGHAYGTNAVAFSPDGTLIASGGRDGAIWLWPATVDLLLQMAEQRIQRPAHRLSQEELRALDLWERQY